MVKYVSIDNERVSAEWWSVVNAMRDDGVNFTVNEGHRTMQRQWFLYNGYKKGLPGFNLAAFPSPVAPHIRTGRIDHAIDFSNDQAAYNWLNMHQLQPRRTVRGESWHLEVPAAKLKAFYQKHKGPRVIKKGSKDGEDIQKVQVYLRGIGFLPKRWNAHNSYTLTVRRAVRAFQRSRKLKVDGVVGPSTFAAMKAAYDRKKKK